MVKSYSWWSKKIEKNYCPIKLRVNTLVSHMQVNKLMFITSSETFIEVLMTHADLFISAIGKQGLVGLHNPAQFTCDYKITFILIFIKSELVSPMFPNVQYSGCRITLNFTFSHCTLSPPVKMNGPKKIKLYTPWRVFIKQWAAKYIFTDPIIGWMSDMSGNCFSF